MKVLVTGAGGAVGTYTVLILLDRGHKVVATDYRRESLVDLDNSVEKYVRDLSNAWHCRTLLDDSPVDAIIHTAAVVDVSKSYDEIKHINVGAVRRLYNHFNWSKTERRCFVHISSGSVYKNYLGTPLSENDRLEATSDYERSKIESEEKLLAMTGAPKVILRPSLIYGPRSRFLGAPLVTIPPIMSSLVGKRVPSFLGGPKLNWVHAEDVARAAVYCVENNLGRTEGKIFNVADDTPIPFGEAINIFSRLYGLDPCIPIMIPPKKILKILAPLIDSDNIFKSLNQVIDKLWRQVSEGDSPLNVKIDREAIEYAVKDTVFNNRLLKSYGFRYQWPNPEAGFKHAIDWYISNGWIPRRKR